MSSSPSKMSQYFGKILGKSGLGRASSSNIKAPSKLEQAINLHRDKKPTKTENWPGPM